MDGLVDERDLQLRFDVLTKTQPPALHRHSKGLSHPLLRFIVRNEEQRLPRISGLGIATSRALAPLGPATCRLEQKAERPHREA
jgi:hypothetical protein